MNRRRGGRLAFRESSEKGLGMMFRRFEEDCGGRPAFAGPLHGNGGFNFGQIAAWIIEEIAYMGDMLSLNVRRERNSWVAQAANPVAEQE